MGDPVRDVERRRWADGAEKHLAALGAAARSLRDAFETAAETSAAPGTDPASLVVDSCAALASWLAGAPAPRGVGKAAAELGAAAGVYRNAAVAYRSLADTDTEAREARQAACAAMLDQGDLHIEVSAALLAAVKG